MSEDVSTRLAKVVEQVRLKKKLEQDKSAVEKELRQKSTRLETLAAQLKKEQVDVDKLEHSSLTAMFHSVLGSREQQLDKERQELLAAQLAYQQVKHQVDYLQQEQLSLADQLETLKGVEAEYEQLLVEKEQVLRQTDQSAASELMSLSEQIAQANAEIKEIREATLAGRNVLAGLGKVISSLDSAEGWGTWDLLGGGLLSTAIKRSRIDEANNGIQEVQTSMSRFKRELADVQQSGELAIQIDGFESFADYFLDGLIIDWIIQSKVKAALEQSNQVKQNIAHMVVNLEAREKSVQNKIMELQEKRRRLVEGA